MALKGDASLFESHRCADTVGQLNGCSILTELAVVFWFLLASVGRLAVANQTRSVEQLWSLKIFNDCNCALNHCFCRLES